MAMSLPQDVGTSTPFELQALMALPCGCVVADFRARSLSVDFVSVEAKGPRCTHADHRSGEILGLGEYLRDDAGDEERDERVAS